MKKILTLIILLLSFGSFATNYYISTTGNNTNSGTTSGAPKATIANVFSTYNLGSGDTIFVAAGTYTETGITVGSDDEGFVITGDALSSGVPTSIFDAGSTARWLLLNNTNNDNITITKLTIKDHKNSDGGDPGGGGGIKIIAGCTGFKATYCHFDNCDTRTASLHHRGGAIYSAEGITIDYCTFKNCNAEYYGGAISIELSPTSSSSIKHSIFYSNVSSNYGGAIFFGVGSTSTLTVENCLFYKNNTTAGEAVVVAMNSYSNLNIMNSTITANGNASNGTGGVLSLSSAKINLTNTIIYNNSGTTYNDVYNNSGTINMVNCCYGNSSEINSITSNTSPKISDPLFTSSATDDYTLSGTSPCIDWGTTTGAPTDDLRQYSRIGNPDVGCYESNGVPLPIELIYFKPIFEDDVVKLRWSTASELNNDYFTIERSNNGLDYIEILKLPGAGNSTNVINYQAVDRDYELGISYYRLKQTDYDGKYKRSNWESILIKLQIDNLTIYPNPTNNKVNISLKSSLSKKDNLFIFDLTGKLFYTNILDLKSGDNHFELELPKVSKGLYILQIGDKQFKLNIND